MDAGKLEYISRAELSVIKTLGGNVKRGLRSDEGSYNGFAEVYFSEIDYGAIRAWKLHKSMTLNLVVPKGNVKFVFFTDKYKNQFQVETIGEENYVRLTVPPKIWFGFKGLEPSGSLIMSLSNQIHDPDEVERMSVGDIDFNWK